MHVAVIDLGKTHAKIAVVDTLRATEIMVIRQPTATDNATRYPSLDHLATERFILDGLREVALEFSLDALTVTTHGATAALLDSTGELVLPVLDYEFDGPDALAEDYRNIRPDFADTGSPLLPGGLNIGAQLHWQRAHFPTQFAKMRTLLTWPQYWVFRLTGERCNDVTSLGCHTDLYEPRHQRYSTLVDTLDLHPCLPPTQPSGSHCGSVLPWVAAETGLPASLPVHIGIHDSNASLVPHLLAHRAPFGVVSTGTWCIAMSIGGAESPLDAARDTLLNVSAYGRAVPSARFMGGRERELLGASNGAQQDDLAAVLERDAPPLIMPSAVAGTGPFPNSPLAWVNTPGTWPDGQRNCAISLYLALMTLSCLDLIGSEGATYVEGPFADDPVFTEMLAAASNRPVFTSSAQTGTSVGAAMLISEPDEPIRYCAVDLDPSHRNALRHYATTWQQYLRHHAI